MFHLWRAPSVHRYSYKQAFIKSPKLKLRLAEVLRISDGIAILEALGEGSLLVGTKRRPQDGYYSMAECTIEELRGKSEAEIFGLLDKRTDQVLERERQRIGMPRTKA